ncbi:MAG TPA: DUF1552 domain-containing protein [Polyangiaceae bacterium]|nr:DUF1552 domain-containing protein [Polyangiaceae bacterium]
MIPLSSRRTFIKGLPLGLAGLAAGSAFWERLISRAVAQEAAQKRFLIWFVPDGLVPEWFWHDAAGPLDIRSDRAQDAELSGTSFSTQIPKADWPTFVLQPLASYSKNILLAKGIRNAGTADHVTSIQSCLTGEEIGTKGNAGGPSIDVIVGQANKTSKHIVPVFRTGVYVKQTKLTGAGAPFHEKDGAAFLEPSSSITTDASVMLDAVGGRATGTSTPSTPGMTGPSAAELKAKTRIAALGAVKARVEALRCAAGSPAAERLEAYIADVARLEALEAQSGGSTGGVTTPFAISPTLDPKNATVKSSEGDIHHLPEVAPFLRELAVTALALDYAPVVTLQWGATGVNKISGSTLTDYRYDFLPNFENKGAGEHGLAHPQDAKFIAAGYNISGESSTRDRVRMRRWVFNQLKLVLDRMAETQDGSGSLLDNTTILYASEFGGPNANSPRGQHSNNDLPYMLIGGKNSPFNLGQGLNVSRSHGDYLYTVAKGMGSTVANVGKGKTVIDGILKA